LREPVYPAVRFTHVIDKNLALLRTLGIEAVGSREFALPSYDVEGHAVAERLAAAGLEGALAVLNPGGGWASKLWPPESFGALAQGLRDRGFVPLVTWGPGEEGLADAVVGSSRGAAVRCFATTLRELVALVRRVRLVVAADTGPLHLACAVGTPVVGIFGPTDPARNGPFSSADVTVRRIPPCAPCHRRHCPVHATVMADIPAEEVLAAADLRLATAGGATVAF
jgi:ADP-heptose:LPS heptosyltransferase